MKRTLVYIMLLATALMTWAFSGQGEPEIHIYLVGDSTMADKPGTAEENPERGWGQLLGVYFKETAVIHNHAVNGRSSKSFREEGRWDVVLDNLQPGDYVFIQFGHNDQKYKDASRYTNPWSSYRRNLEKYVEEVQARRAHPVVLSSIVRRKFNEYGTLVDTHGAYPFVARQVAQHLAVPFIDMQLLTEDYVAQLGPEKSKDLYLWLAPGAFARYPEGKQDDTHLNPHGARIFAGMVAEQIRLQALPLARHLK